MHKSWAAVALFVLMCAVAVPAAQAQGGCAPGVVHCLPPPYAVPAAPVWATFNAVAGGNYPGGDQEFTIFVLNSDSPPLGNVTVQSAALTTPFQNVTLSGLPVELARGQSLSSNMTVQIPSGFAPNNFTAKILIHVSVANSTVSNAPTTLTGSDQVFVLGSPLGGAPSSTTSSGQQAAQVSGLEPLWAIVSPLAYGNYPGGNEKFTVFVADTTSPPLGNVSLINETLTAPSLPPPNNSNGATGLPVALSAGQGILTTIYLPIPSSISQGSFTATLVVNLEIANGTDFFAKQLTVSTTVSMLNLPGVTAPPGGSTTSSGASSSQTTTSQGGGSASSVLYSGVAIAAVVVVALVALLVRRRGKPG